MCDCAVCARVLYACPSAFWAYTQPVDSAGKCGRACPAELTRVDVAWNEAIDKQCTWAPADFSVQLQRLTAHQVAYQRLWYNEVIVDAAWWRDHLPGVVEAVFGDRSAHAAFIERFGLDAAIIPFVELDIGDWTGPVHPTLSTRSLS